jgi:hypothetical protein
MDRDFFRKFLDIVTESSPPPSVMEEIIDINDSFDIELNEHFVIETGVVGYTEDGIVIEADETILGLLEVNDILTEGIELEETKPGLWANIHAKRERIKQGSGEKMRKPGSKGAPSAQNFKDAAKEGAGEYMDTKPYTPNTKSSPPKMDTKPAEEKPLQGNPKDYITKEDQGASQRVRNDAFAELDKIRSGGTSDLEQQADNFRQRAQAGQAGKSTKWSEMSPAQQEELRRQGFGPQKTTNEAEYQGREVPLGKPMAGDVKKSKVYVRKPNGKVVKVNFGDKNMKIKKSNPNRRKSFRARHRCENPGPRWKARYWSCRAW